MSAIATATPTFAPHINLAEKDRQPLIELLNGRLADTADLYSQVKQAHWNVKGLNFFQLHGLFDQLAGEIFPFIDVIAEKRPPWVESRWEPCEWRRGKAT